MLKIKNYVKAESLEQAYELNQKRTACVLGRYGLAENGKPEHHDSH